MLHPQKWQTLKLKYNSKIDNICRQSVLLLPRYVVNQVSRLSASEAITKYKAQSHSLFCTQGAVKLHNSILDNFII